MRGSGSKQYLMTQGPLKRRDTLEEDTMEGDIGMFVVVVVIIFLIVVYNS